MARRPRPDGELHHLGGEHEDGGQPGQRRDPLVELATGAPERHGHGRGRQDAGRDRGRGVEEAVGDVHALLLSMRSLLHIIRNKGPQQSAGPATDLRVAGDRVLRSGHEGREVPLHGVARQQDHAGGREVHGGQ